MALVRLLVAWTALGAVVAAPLGALLRRAAPAQTVTADDRGQGGGQPGWAASPGRARASGG